MAHCKTHTECYSHFHSLKNILFICYLFRGEGKDERERNNNVRETSTGCLSHALRLRTEPATLACALTGNRTCDLSICRTMPNQATPARACPRCVQLLHQVKRYQSTLASPKQSRSLKSWGFGESSHFQTSLISCPFYKMFSVRTTYLCVNIFTVYNYIDFTYKLHTFCCTNSAPNYTTV